MMRDVTARVRAKPVLALLVVLLVGGSTSAVFRAVSRDRKEPMQSLRPPFQRPAAMKLWVDFLFDRGDSDAFVRFPYYEMIESSAWDGWDDADQQFSDNVYLYRDYLRNPTSDALDARSAANDLFAGYLRLGAQPLREGLLEHRVATREQIDHTLSLFDAFLDGGHSPLPPPRAPIQLSAGPAGSVASSASIDSGTSPGASGNSAAVPSVNERDRATVLRGAWPRHAVAGDAAALEGSLPGDYASAKLLDVRIVADNYAAVAVAVARANMRMITALDPAEPGSDEELRLDDLESNYVDYIPSPRLESPDNAVFGVNVEGRRSLVRETNELVLTILREELGYAGVASAKIRSSLVY